MNTVTQISADVVQALSDAAEIPIPLFCDTRRELSNVWLASGKSGHTSQPKVMQYVAPTNPIEPISLNASLSRILVLAERIAELRVWRPEDA